MPSGRTHDRITLWTFPWVTLGTWFVTRSSDAAIVVGAGFLFSGLMFGPDLDINSRQFQRWGWFRVLWIPYQKMLRHRSVWSHGFIVGTLGRCLYLGFWLLVILMPGLILSIPMGDRSWQSQFTILHERLKTLLSHPLTLNALVGLELGAMSHSLSDWLGSAYKQRQRPRKPRKR